MKEFYEPVVPSLEPVDEFITVGEEKVPVVRTPEMKEEPEPAIHHHNNLDQPTIDLNRDVVGTILHSDLGGVTADQHHTQLHAASHQSGGGDDLSGKTLANMTLNSGTLSSPVIGTMNATGGTATNLTLVTPTVGTPTVTGGTATNITLVTPTIGTPALTGGTVNPIQFNCGGTVGVSGTAIYVKTVDFSGSAVTYGTIVFTKGIATSVS